MTDDIVTRLRKHHEWFGTGGQPTSVWEDAADEIERLREMVNTITNAQDGWGRVPRLEAEIERLRADRDRWRMIADKLANEVDAQILDVGLELYREAVENG